MVVVATNTIQLLQSPLTKPVCDHLNPTLLAPGVRCEPMYVIIGTAGFFFWCVGGGCMWTSRCMSKFQKYKVT